MTVSTGAVLLDTDAFSYLHRGGDRAQAMGRAVAGRVPLLSFVTVGELLRGAEQGGWGSVRRRRLEQAIGAMTVVPYDEVIVRTYAEITADAVRRGHPLGQQVHSNDAWIAATAVAHGVALVTGNRRHFEGALRLTVIP